MSEINCIEGVRLRLAERADFFAPGMSRKVALLIPYKAQIRKLRSRKASYDCIRLILAEENIKVSLSTLYRFCKKLLRENAGANPKSRSPGKNGQMNMTGIEPTDLAVVPEDQRRPLPGPWSRRKRGPRIANSKTL